MKNYFAKLMLNVAFFASVFLPTAATGIILKEIFDVNAFYGDLHVFAVRPLLNGKNVLISRRGGVVDMLNLETKTHKEVFFKKKETPYTGILCLEVIEPPFFICGVADLSTNKTNFFLKSTLTEKDLYQMAPCDEPYFGIATQIIPISPGVVVFRSGYKTITIWDWLLNKAHTVKTDEISDARFRIVVPPGIMVEKFDSGSFSLYNIQNKKTIYTEIDSVGSYGLCLFGKDISNGLFSSFKKFFWYSCDESSIFFLDTNINGAKLQTLDQHKGHICGLFEFFLGDKAYLISGDLTGKICLWYDDGISGISLIDSIVILDGLRGFFVEREQKGKKFRLFVVTEKDRIKVFDCSIDEEKK